jgi:hypothetical protein
VGVAAAELFRAVDAERVVSHHPAPKGATVRGILEGFIKEELVKRGYHTSAGWSFIAPAAIFLTIATPSIRLQMTSKMPVFFRSVFA